MRITSGAADLGWACPLRMGANPDCSEQPRSWRVGLLCPQITGPLSLRFLGRALSSRRNGSKCPAWMGSPDPEPSMNTSPTAGVSSSAAGRASVKPTSWPGGVESMLQGSPSPCSMSCRAPTMHWSRRSGPNESSECGPHQLRHLRPMTLPRLRALPHRCVPPYCTTAACGVRRPSPAGTAEVECLLGTGVSPDPAVSGSPAMSPLALCAGKSSCRRAGSTTRGWTPRRMVPQ
jgi:hypothetical protein